MDQWPDFPIAYDGSREEFNIFSLDRLLAVPFHDAHRTQKKDQLTVQRQRKKFASGPSLAESVLLTPVGARTAWSHPTRFAKAVILTFPVLEELPGRTGAAPLTPTAPAAVIGLPLMTVGNERAKPEALGRNGKVTSKKWFHLDNIGPIKVPNSRKRRVRWGSYAGSCGEVFGPGFSSEDLVF